MELSFNYGIRRYLISDNYFYIPLFIFSLIIFLKRKQRKNREKEISISPLNTRGGDNSAILQGLYDQCLSDDLYVQVNDSKVKQIIRKMLNIPANKPVIISTAVYLAAVLKTKYAPLILQQGGTQLIVSNFRGFMSKGVGTVVSAYLVALGSTTIVVSSIPLVLIALLYSSLHIDCNSFVDTLPMIQGSSQYIETVINDDAPIIVAPPHTSKLVYHEFDQTKVSSYTTMSCYVRDNCLGPETIKRRNHSKPSKFVPLEERTKTLEDLKFPLDDLDAIDVNSINYKQKT
jgi:hypothetical protein